MTQIATLESFRHKIPKFYHYLLILFAFTLPIGVTINEFISYLIRFDLIPLLSDENKLGFATTFMDHLSYAPYLALSR